MKRVMREFRHDLREISGHLAAVGIIGILFVVTAYFVQVNLYRQDLPNTITLPALEALVSFLGRLWHADANADPIGYGGWGTGLYYVRTRRYTGASYVRRASSDCTGPRRR